ncbi:MAG: restriction endonuclease [Pseudomonadota bacterium]
MIDLTYEAALRSFWRKRALSAFLDRSAIRGLPSWLPDESKRDYLVRVFELLQASDEGRSKILQLAKYLAEQASFPDLHGWEESEEKLAIAEGAVQVLRSYLNEQEEQVASEDQRQKARERFREIQVQTRASQQSVQSLSDRLSDLSAELGTAAAGKSFEAWFYDLMDFSEIVSRRPFKTDGREIDGSITIGDTTYLVECKFTSEQSCAPDIDVFRSKVDSKADNTMGVFVSISGYSSVAIRGASGRKTPLLLLDHSHLYRVLGGMTNFKDVIERVRRHASQTGEAYLPAGQF